MATEIKIPALGESITSGILATWLVQEGSYVQKDQPIFELETDKITSEGMAEASGTITFKAAEGDEVDIGQVVAVIDETAQAPQSTPAPAAAVEAKPVTTETAPAPTTSTTSHDSVSPAVRRIASETGVNPANVAGTGKDGRVTKGDMLNAQQTPCAPKAQPQAQCSQERTTRKKMTPLRQRIAERLVQAQSEAAMLTTFNEVDMSPIMSLRSKYQEQFVAKHGVKLGFMSFFIKAVVGALKAVPEINAQIDGKDIVQNHFYDIGVAVGTEKGLIVPVIRDCDSKSYAQVEKDIIGYAKKARDGKIQLSDMEGGVFTISNGGIYGSMLSTPILNAPQSAILGMHNIQKRAVVVNNEIVIRPMMYLALSYDHRLVDGKGAVTFLIKVKEALEDPARIVFDI